MALGEALGWVREGPSLVSLVDSELIPLHPVSPTCPGQSDAQPPHACSQIIGEPLEGRLQLFTVGGLNVRESSGHHLPRGNILQADSH